MRARFVLRQKSQYSDGKWGLCFEAVSGPSEDPQIQKLWEETPSGSVLLSGLKRQAAERFHPGRHYHMDLSLVR